MKNKVLIILVLFSVSYSLNAQKEKYSDGYVVFNNGDTIYGKLRNFSDEESCIKIKLLDVSGEKVKVKNKDVNAYIRGDDYFISTSYVDNKHTVKGFLKLLKSGKINLYQHSYYSTFIAGNVVSGSYATIYFMERNGHFFQVRKAGFKDWMVGVLSDDDKLVTKIKEKELKYRDIESIVDSYNKN